MTRNTLILLVILSLVLKDISATRDKRTKQQRNARNVGPASSKTDIPTAEQIIRKLIGSAKRAPDPVSAQTILVVAPNSPLAHARSPVTLKTNLGNVQLIPNGATPETEDPLDLPPPPPGYHYGRSKKPRSHRYDDDDEYKASDGSEEEDLGEDDRQQDDDNPADEENHDQRYGIGRSRSHAHGRCPGCAKKGCGQCNCVCWKGIKPHVEWVRVPVCYRPCAVCCPKHEEEGACAAVCQPCCQCCCGNSCCHHQCHCCPCCCRRCVLFRPPIAPRKLKKLKSKTTNKKTKIKKKKTTKKAKKRTTKRKH